MTGLIIASPPSSSSVLVFALSGMGKSHLAQLYPAHTYDTDEALRSALRAELGPTDDERGQLIRWRRLARSDARRDHHRPELHTWARIRRRIHQQIREVLVGPRPVMVLTNFLSIPWDYCAHYGIELGRYVEHWSGLDRVADNEQIEEKNTELEGYEPLVRMPPGTFLSGRSEIVAWMEDARRRSPA